MNDSLFFDPNASTPFTDNTPTMPADSSSADSDVLPPDSPTGSSTHIPPADSSTVISSAPPSVSAPVSPAGPASTPPAQPASTTGALTLFVEPRDGIKFITDAITNAKHSIYLEMYYIRTSVNSQIVQPLIDASKKDIKVSVIIDPAPHGIDPSEPKTILNELAQGKGISAQLGKTFFKQTHVKVMLIDSELVDTNEATAYIMTANFDSAALGNNNPRYPEDRSNREYAIRTTDPQIIRDLVTMFNTDMNQNLDPFTTTLQITAPDLVVSSKASSDARDIITNLIKNAQTSLQIEMEAITDDRGLMTSLSEAGAKINQAAAAAGAKPAQPGVTPPGVRIIISDQQPDLAIPNTTVRVASAGPNKIPNLYMHAKLIIADGQQAFIGSQNLTEFAMDKNREVGIIITDPGIVQELSKTFEEDWQSYPPK